MLLSAYTYVGEVNTIENAIFYLIVCWLNKRKARIDILCRTPKHNMKKNIYSPTIFLAKTMKVNKIAMKFFSKICRS